MTENQRQQLLYNLCTGLVLRDGSLISLGSFMPTKHLCNLIHMDLGWEWCLLSTPYFFTDYSEAVVLLWILFVICLCHTVMSVSCSLNETDSVLAFLYVTFSLVFVTYPYAVLSQVWYVIVSFLIFVFFSCFVLWKTIWTKEQSREGWTDFGKGEFTDDR